MKMLWVVGKVINYEAKAWEFIGVFEEESEAVKVCKTARYFIGPAELNVALPDETVPWCGSYYPLFEKNPHAKEIEL